eukprot:scpid91638/ scgid2338/ 
MCASVRRVCKHLTVIIKVLPWQLETGYCKTSWLATVALCLHVHSHTSQTGHLGSHITNWTPLLTHHKLHTWAHTPQTGHQCSHTTNWTPVLTHHKLDTSADTPQTGHLEAW